MIAHCKGGGGQSLQRYSVLRISKKKHDDLSTLLYNTFLNSLHLDNFRERRGDVYRDADGDRAQELGGVVRGHRLVRLLPRLYWRDLHSDGAGHPGEEEGAQERGQESPALQGLDHVTVTS